LLFDRDCSHISGLLLRACSRALMESALGGPKQPRGLNDLCKKKVSTELI
jgi:hypothetical protein